VCRDNTTNLGSSNKKTGADGQESTRYYFWALSLAALIVALLAGGCSNQESLQSNNDSGKSGIVRPTTTAVSQAEFLPKYPVVPIPPDKDVLKFTNRLERIGNNLPKAFRAHEVGEEESFWVTDMPERTNYQVVARLEHITPNALWYVDSEVQLPTTGLTVAAQSYEQQVYPRLTTAFGDLGLPPGIRLSILNTPLRGVLGYTGSHDNYPETTHPYSNHRPMLYMDTSHLVIGNRQYLAVLAHELQHLIHSAADVNEEAWVNEGLSELATELAGYTSVNARVSSNQPPVSLTLWPENSPFISHHYIGAHRFFRYFLEHHGGTKNLPLLLQIPEDGIKGINAFLQLLGKQTTFTDVFGDWAVANLLGRHGEDPYSYKYPENSILPRQILSAGKTTKGSVAPFSTHYIAVLPNGSETTIEFQGKPTTKIISADPISGKHCWWSNRGDGIHSRLTREVDLLGVDAASLTFRVWSQIESEWDYAYVMVSSDGGTQWDILEGEHTTAENPMGNNFGFGYTGTSNGWLRENIDLAPYSGQKILLSFEYLTDDAVNGEGLCLDDIAIAEIGFFDNAEQEQDGWIPEGFMRTNNLLSQKYLVHKVEYLKDGSHQIQRMTLSTENSGKFTISGYGEQVEKVVVLVSSVTPTTSQEAGYTLRLP
jgi:immune inhibitor A